MKFLGIFLTFIVLLEITTVVAEDTFNGLSLTLSTAALSGINAKFIGQALTKFKDVVIARISSVQKANLVEFNTTTDEIKLKELTTNFKTSTTTLKEGVLTVTYTNPFDLTYNFTTFTIISGVHVSNESSSITILGKTITLTQNYTTEVPVSTIAIDAAPGAVVLKTGIFTDAISSVIKKQFGQVVETLKTNLNDSMKAVDPLKEFEEFKLVHEKITLVEVARSKIKAITKPSSLIRLIGSKILRNNKTYEPTTLCPYQPTTSEDESELCFCKYLFPEILKTDIQRNVSLSDWKLEGKAVELYEVMPELVDYYPPDASFFVETKVVGFVPEGTGLNLAKEYNFKIGGELILNLVATFGLVIEGIQENSQFYVNQTAAPLKKMDTNLQIPMVGKIMLNRFMQYEESLMVNHKMFNDGIPIPQLTSMTPMIKAGNSFCIVLQTPHEYL